MKQRQLNVGDLVEVTYMHPNEDLVGAPGIIETVLEDKRRPGYSVYRVLINEVRHPMISFCVAKFGEHG